MPRGKRTTTPVDPNETKRAKFLRLANPRVNRAYAAIQSLGKLGTNAYERTAEDAVKIREILHREVDAACDKLVPKEAGAGEKAPGLGNVLS